MRVSHKTANFLNGISRCGQGRDFGGYAYVLGLFVYDVFTE